jgi:hypothetical protein
MPKKSPPENDIVKPRGIGLKVCEWKEVDQIADELEWKPGAVTVYAVHYFLKEWREGRPPKKRKNYQNRLVPTPRSNRFLRHI